MISSHLDRLNEDDNSSQESSGIDSSNHSMSHSILESSISDSHGTSGNSPRDSGEAEIIASKVTRQVFWLKMTVLGVLMVAALIVATSIYITTRRSEAKTFE